MSQEIQTVHSQLETKMKTELANPAIRHFLRTGDLAGLEPAHQDQILVKMCAHYGVDPVLRPFIMIALNGKTVWYPTKQATDQLANKFGLNRELGEVKINMELGIASQICTIRDPNGRVETASAHTSIVKFERDKSGAVVSKTLQGEDMANALMRLETKAKRRATLSWFGLVEPQNSDGENGIAVAEQMAAVAQITQAQATTNAPEQSPALPESAEAPKVPASIEPKRKPGRPSRAEIEARAMAENSSIPAPVTVDTISHKTQLETIQAGFPTPEQVKVEFDKAAEAAKQREAEAALPYWQRMAKANPENYANFNPETSGRIVGEPEAEFVARFKAPAPAQAAPAPATVAEHVTIGTAIGEQVKADFGMSGVAKYNRTLTEHKLELHKALLAAGLNLTVPDDIRIASKISEAADGKIDLFQGANVLPNFAAWVADQVNAARNPAAPAPMVFNF